MSPDPVILICDCCGFRESFPDGDAAFAAGWDAPPYFSQYTACPLCPGVCAMRMVDHSEAHARWAKEGRPRSQQE